MLASTRTILVTGATGKQGRATIDALLDLPETAASPPFRILAMARDPASKSAQRLATLPNVDVIQGDLDDMGSVFARAGEPVWGVFSVQVNSDDELRQGVGVINAAVAHGHVRHFVYASGDRGGPEKSAADPTRVKNFAVKFAVEKHLMQAAAESSEDKSGGMTYTILRPATFMENQTPDRHGKGFGRMWMQMRDGERPLQLVSVRDIGRFAAQAFVHGADSDADSDANSDKTEKGRPAYRNAAISLAGDELSARQAQAVFRNVVGSDMPLAPCLVGKALKTFLRDTVGDMFEWFENDGYGADVAACRRMVPGMLDYATWLRQYSGFV